MAETAYPKMSRVSEPHGVLLGDANEEKREGFITGARTVLGEIELYAKELSKEPISEYYIKPIMDKIKELKGEQTMAEIKEAYVSFETAKLMKEKGFNENCYTCYVIDEIKHYDYRSKNNELIDGVISAPTQQMAMRWLREVYYRYINIMPQWLPRGYWFSIEKLDRGYTVDRKDIYNKTYEEAVEAAIKYCLKNLIEDK